MSPSFIHKHLLLATALLGTVILKVSNGTQDFEFSTSNPFTVAIDAHLFTVSKYDTHVIINSTNPNYKSCDVALKSKEGFVIPTIKAAATSSNKIVVASFRSYDFDPSSHDKLLVNYTILLIDPFTCSLVDVASPTELVSGISPLVPPEIVVHEDNTFDVFYWSQTRCSPCRFDDEGKRVELQRNLKPESTVPMYFHLQEIGQDQNYAYALNFGNDRSKLKVLDRDFNVLDSTDLDTVVNEFTVRDVANASYIGAVVQLPESPYTYKYTLFEFDGKLKPVFSSSLKLWNDYSNINASSIIDSKAESYVTLWENSFDNDNAKINLVRYDASGRRIGDTVEIASIAMDQNYSVQTFLLQDKKYCLVVHEISWNSALTKIKCIDLPIK